ncbi:DUF2330 domain-containing protein [Polyangium jinanense]|uniref:DUF2330 domain-containing protein n=1 Tax=Polyangium jinanense TaxID=2829994 RepID=A0A9X4ANV8_9BACT|nr:DUF2330 domain-containing protein [Polyangium jinanense]MDC3953495.1 DUF2330 domain-containing protein [Polyangium jinanense]MDC3979384.1 DUF2330 domain-containing protein [Polyangium jinanense]
MRLLPLTSLAAITTLAMTQPADAAGAWLPSGEATPIEQRVAVAVGPTRVALWTSLRASADSGPFGIIVPVAPGAALDHSSDAWLEALNAATAPRIFPPTGVTPTCPGEDPSGGSDPFHVTDDLGAVESLAPVESVLLPDTAAVLAWANLHGFDISPDVATALDDMAGKRFFAERFNAPSAPFVTSTLRVVSEAADPVLPLALTRAGAADLRVTAWLLGKGRAALSGSKPITLTTNALSWEAGNDASNYAELREQELLAWGKSAVLIEAASHDALVRNVPIANGTGSVTGVVTSFFQRAATYGDGNPSTSACITTAAIALDESYPVAETCPRAGLGIVDGGPACVESPAGAEIDPAKLRCGGITDDLAVALSGMVPKDAVLTRATLFIAKNAAGSTWPVTFEAAASDVDPLLTATSLDLASCNNSSSSTTGSGSSSSGGNNSSGGQGASNGVGVGGSAGWYDDDYDSDVACSCVGTADPVVPDDTGSGGDDYYYDDSSSEDCSGDTTEDDYYDDSSSEDCSGDTTEDDYYYDDSSSEDCSGDTSEDDYYDDSSSEDCSGDTSEDDSYDDSYDDSSSEGCSGDTDDDSDSSDSSDSDCSGDTDDDSDSSDDWGDWEEARKSSSAARRVATIDVSHRDDASSVVRHAPAKKMRKRGPKASVITLGLLAILAPLRRLARPDRSRRSAKDKPRRERSST